MKATDKRKAGWLPGLVRRLWAQYMPLSFAQWVNSERCQIQIWNDPSGDWRVQIGVLLLPQGGTTLGNAMAGMVERLDADKRWQWTTDYLRSLPEPNTQGER